MQRVLPRRDNAFLRTAADEAERVLSHGRSVAYLALGFFGTAASFNAHRPDWWLLPVILFPFSLTALVPSVRLLLGKDLPRGQPWWASVADVLCTALIQFITVALVPALAATCFGALVALFILTITACGLRLDRRLLWAVTALCFTLLTVFVLWRAEPTWLFGFPCLLSAAAQGHFGVRAVRKAAERDALARFVPAQVADRIVHDPSGLSLGGASVVATIMFTDLRGFTRLSESRPAAEVMALLNRLHAIQVAAVFGESGTVNKFTGDGMLAIFGAPERHPDDASAAMRAARQIVLGVRALAKEGVEISISVGLHRGLVVAGNVGSSQHLEYTVIGDVVNVAARLESLTREHPGVDVILSREVVAAATDNPALTPLGPATLKGRTAPIDVYALPVT